MKMDYSSINHLTSPLSEHKNNKKKETLEDLLIKIGGDLLFHKQVQYHRRCEA